MEIHFKDDGKAFEIQLKGTWRRAKVLIATLLVPIIVELGRLFGFW